MEQKIKNKYVLNRYGEVVKNDNRRIKAFGRTKSFSNGLKEFKEGLFRK